MNVPDDIIAAIILVPLYAAFAWSIWQRGIDGTWRALHSALDALVQRIAHGRPQPVRGALDEDIARLERELGLR